MQFPEHWIHGSADCGHDENPFFQTHALDESTFAIRQNKCTHFEAPFLYLLIGRDASLLLDSGARPEDGRRIPILDVVTRILAARPGSPLIVAHTHSHLDHLQGDDFLSKRPNTRIVPASIAAIAQTFAIPDWPNGVGELDLGDRRLLIVPTPGHDESHIAIFDERTGAFFTGDVLYPGLITIRDWSEFRKSAARLAAFAATHAVSHVLGAHIELASDGTLFRIGTTYQPDEHPLALANEHIAELHEVCEALGDEPRIERREHFILRPP